MRGAAGAGNNDLETGGLGALGEGKQPVRGPVRRDDAGFTGDAERCKRIGGMDECVVVCEALFRVMSENGGLTPKM